MTSPALTETSTAALHCRLCAGVLTKRFSLRLLGQQDVGYFACAKCGSLQTELPSWLEQAYGQNLSNLDTGAAQRNLKNMAACYTVARVLKLTRLVDVGGGDGLLCRLLRDYGLRCYVRDKYARPTYAQGFDQPDFDAPDMVSAFEVFEHLPQPALELEQFFAQTPQVVLISTELYNGQGTDWPYLAPESGQHVFFYTKAALEHVAQRFGYKLVLGGSFQLFLRPNAASGFQARLLSWLLRPRTCRLITAFMLLLPTPGVWRDHQEQRLVR
jgi:Methyltransferase domain